MAKEASAKSGQPKENHFVDFHEMVRIGSGAERGFDDGVKLSRYACYLIVQNADPAKVTYSRPLKQTTTILITPNSG